MTFLSTMKQAHRLSATVLGVFIAMHLGVHLFALGGADRHEVALKAIQGFYRNPIIEPLLILAILVQVVSGLRLLTRKLPMPNKSLWTWVQLLSGALLVWFMLQHTAAALLTRYGLGLDTNFSWAAGPLQNPTFRNGFIIYYFLLVFAVFAHAAAIIHFKRRHDKVSPRIVISFGALLAATLVATFAGAFYPIKIPTAYEAVYAAAARGEIPTRATTH